MPIIELEDALGIVESDGKVKCDDCINWDKDFDHEKDTVIAPNDVEGEPRVYICDYCGKKL